MKKLILLLLCSLPALAQNGFKIEDNILIWERAYSADNVDIASVLDKNPNLKTGSFMDNFYKGMGVDIKNTCNSQNGLMKNNVKFQFVVMTSPTGYVVKVKDLKFLEKYGPMQARIRANAWEQYFVDGTNLKSDATSVENMGCMDNFLSSLFAPAPVTTETRAMTSN